MIGKALSCLVFGVAGTALTASAASPATVAAIAGSLMAGAAGNFFHQIADAEQERLIATVFHRNTGIDENHHILRALRLAHLAALEAVLKNYDTAWSTIRDKGQRTLSERFSKELHRFITEQTKDARTGGGVSDFEKTVLADLPDALDTALASRGAHPPSLATNDLARIRGEIEMAVLQELLHETATTLTEVPPLFQTAFTAASPDGWFDLFVRDGAARLKSDAGFRSIWTAEKLARLEFIGKAVLTELAEVKTDIKSLVASLPAEIAAQIGDRDRLVAELEQVRAKYQETESLVANFLRLMIGQTVPPDQFAATLYANMERWKASGDRLGLLDRTSNLIPELFTLRRRAEAARREERIEDYWLIIEEIDRIEQGDFERGEKKLRETEAELKSLRNSLVSTKKLKRDTALATFRVVEAAKAIIEIIDLEILDAKARTAAYNHTWKKWYARGRGKWLNLNVGVAVEVARISLERTKHGGSKEAEALSRLGIALTTLGERQSGTERLFEAVAVFRAALDKLSPKRTPILWAATQNNLANALQALGAREGGTEHLSEAVAVCREVLEERTREQNPHSWAITQTNLGNALTTLGQREGGAERLTEAVAAFRAALEETPRERVPLDWAMAQMNLANALQILGEYENSTERLIEAVEAYRAALEATPRRRVPFQWGWTQANLGNALVTLGQFESNTERLIEAVAAHRAALEELTRERVPLDWAMAQMDLGIALTALGELESGTERLVEAVTAYRAALEEATREDLPLRWASAQVNLANTLRAIGEREIGNEWLVEAVAAYRTALEEMTRERAPLDFATAQEGLSLALAILGLRESSTERFIEAVEACISCLEVASDTWPEGRLQFVRDLFEHLLKEIERRLSP